MGCGGTKEEPKGDKKAQEAAAPKGNNADSKPKEAAAAQKASPKSGEKTEAPAAAAAAAATPQEKGEKTEAEAAKKATAEAPREERAEEPQPTAAAAAATEPVHEETAPPPSVPPLNIPPKALADDGGAPRGDGHRGSVMLEAGSTEFRGPGPSADFPYDTIFACFGEGNGLLFRLVDERHHSWAFYNDTTEYVMRVAVTFGAESEVRALGEAVMTMHDEDTGRCTVEVDVRPGETQLFMRGEYNGRATSYDADPIPYEERKEFDPKQ